MKLFGLIGEKLGHSLSPEIHNKVFKDNNIDGLYNLFSVKKDFENNNNKIISLDSCLKRYDVENNKYYYEKKINGGSKNE